MSIASRPTLLLSSLGRPLPRPFFSAFVVISMLREAEVALAQGQSVG